MLGSQREDGAGELRVIPTLRADWGEQEVEGSVSGGPVKGWGCREGIGGVGDIGGEEA